MCVLIIIRVFEKVLRAYRLALIIIFCAYASIVYYICCHFAAHELDVNKVISIRDSEKTPRTFVKLPNGQLLKMIKVVKL